MDMRPHITADLRRRSALLPQEVAGWRQMSDENKRQMGIHQSQIASIELELTGLDDAQQQLLADLDPADEPQEFATQRDRAERGLSALHGIASIFRGIFAQRQEDSSFRRALRAADLIAADCYRPAIKLAVKWQAIDKHSFREPPLTFLNAMALPAAFTRSHSFGMFDLPVAAYDALKLPISLISIPFHYAPAIWTYCSIYHEVGHPLDRDLGLREALIAPLRERLAAEMVDAARVTLWEEWLREIIADVFGVLFGGEAYVRTMTELLFLPQSEVVTLRVGAEHPNPYVRLFLLGALLRRVDASLFTSAANEMEAFWTAVYGAPPAPLAFLGDCPAVAEVLLDTPLETLGGHVLRDFAPSPGDDHELTTQLAKHVGSGLPRPSPAQFPIRLVPAAAQMAIRKGVTDLEATQTRSLDYIDAIPQPAFLGPQDALTDKRNDFLRGLVRNTDFLALSTASS